MSGASFPSQVARCGIALGAASWIALEIDADPR